MLAHTTVSTFRALLATIGGVCLAAAIATAQPALSRIEGSVTDTSGGALPGVAVTLSVADLSGKSVVVATHADGRPSRDIPPGTVTLRRGGIDFTLRIEALPAFHASHDDPLTTLIPIVGIAGSKRRILLSML